MMRRACVKCFCDVRDAYLTHAPLAHALFRCAELLPLCQRTLEGPVLDLGCGAGEFAEFALDGPIDVGLDISATQLALAARTHRYQRLERADARRLPFPAGAFRTVISISALEHMQEPENVLAEITRVLAPGGAVIGTVTMAEINDHLFYPGLFRSAGLRPVADYYERQHRQCFQHHALRCEAEWLLLLTRSGLRLMEYTRVVSARLVRIWDLLLPAAIPAWMIRRLRAEYPSIVSYLLRRSAGFFGQLLSDSKDGCVLFFSARKP